MSDACDAGSVACETNISNLRYDINSIEDYLDRIVILINRLCEIGDIEKDTI